jgi:hypothetical protein
VVIFQFATWKIRPAVKNLIQQRPIGARSRYVIWIPASALSDTWKAAFWTSSLEVPPRGHDELEPRTIGAIYHICLAYFFGLFFREYPHKSYGLKYGTLTYLHFRILKFPLTNSLGLPAQHIRPILGMNSQANIGDFCALDLMSAQVRWRFPKMGGPSSHPFKSKFPL